MKYLTTALQRRVQDVLLAQKNARTVRDKNAPTRADNRKRKAEWTAKIEAGIAVGPWKNKPLPFKQAKWAKEVLRRETLNRHRLEKRTPEEWRARIDKFQGHLKLRLACIVWMDFFSKRPAVDPWPHLDDLISVPGAIPPDGQVVNGLIRLGYSPHKAVERGEAREDPAEAENEAEGANAA